MSNEHRHEATRLVTSLSGDAGGERASQPASELLPLVYEDLHLLAKKFMAGERGNHTLQPTALLHEAYLRLVDASQVNWRGRTHFFAVAARAMRRILIDHARQKRSAKRGGDQIHVTLDESLNAAGGNANYEVLGLDEAIERLASLDQRQAKVVELRFFGGLTMDEIAHVLGVAKRTVEGDWTHARAWLKRELDTNVNR